MPLGDDIYAGSASFGRLSAYISAIIATIISVVLFILGITKYREVEQVYTKQATATVNEAVCDGGVLDQTVKPPVYNFKCTLHITYMANGVSTTSTLDMTDSKKKQKGDTLMVEFNPSVPTSVRLALPSNHTVGMVLICIALVILLFAWGWVWITGRYKFAAAASGVSTAWNLIR